MKCIFKFGILCLLMAATTIVGAGETNNDGPSAGIFYQPWQADLSLTKSDWNNWMVRLHEDGLDTLYLQWLRYGDMDFLDEDLKTGQPFIQTLLDAAVQQGIVIFVGLFSDPGFFQSLDLKKEELDRSLSTLQKKHLNTAIKFDNRYGRHPAFGGWYLPEEIDDLHWQSPQRKKLFHKHLDRMNDGLLTLHEKKPVALSAFFSGALSPRKFALFCREILDGSDNLLLVQDGLGGRMDMATTQKYHDSLDSLLGEDKRIFWVLELFNDDLPGPAFRGSAIEPRELNERLAVVHDNFRGRRLCFFSLRYWMDKEARLSTHYRRHFYHAPKIPSKRTR